jgi:penicillin amidase
MYFDLQGKSEAHEISRGWLKDHSSAEQLAFLMPNSSRWDASLDSDAALPDTSPIPTTAPDWWQQSDKTLVTKVSALEMLNEVGSNNWAVSGQRSASGAAIVSDDMHLGIRLPGTWYRASLQFPDANGAMQRIVGVTLPGAIPVIVAGSNGHVAWGFTNSYGDYLDLVEVKTNAQKPDQICIHENCEALKIYPETIKVKGGAAVEILVKESSVGPLREVDGKTYAVHWVAHTPQALNFNVQKMEGVTTAEQAMAVAATFGMPAQNIMIADQAGNIAWTIAGPLPKRSQSSWDSSFPIGKDNPQASWNSFLTPEEYPRILNPKDGQLWTANSQQLKGSGAEIIGNGGFDIGARAQQIRDDLRALPAKASVQDVYQITLDDRALFFATWRERVLKVLTPDAIKDHPQRAEFLTLLNTTWTGHASVDSVAYTMSHDYLFALYDTLFSDLNKTLGKLDQSASMRTASSRWPAVIARLVDEQPAAWLPAKYKNWDEVQLAAIDQVIKTLTENNQSMAQATWGKRNTTTIAHPMASAMPGLLRKWLSVPPDMMAGDMHMPRIASPNFGQSERFTVSPGQEEQGILTMPGGQSGHPLSPFFLAGHADWVSGKPTPLLPGSTAHTLRLEK